MHTLLKLMAVPAILMAASPLCSASVVDGVEVLIDRTYGTFTGTIDSASTGSAATIDFEASLDRHPSFTLDFTNSADVITDVMFSGARSRFTCSVS